MLLYVSLQWTIMSLVFISPTFWLSSPVFICANGKECDENSGGCEPGSVLQTNGYTTLTSEFQLYCDRKYLRGLAQSCIFFGACFGSIILTTLSDKVGRRPTFIYSQLIASISLILTGFSSSVGMYIIFSMCSGFLFWPV